MDNIKLTQEQSNDLLKEKSLWAVYKLSWRLPKPYFLLIAPIFGLTLICFALYANVSNKDLISFVRDILDLGISFATSILGFLIAGFTIFATLTDRKLFVKLAAITNPDSNLSWLKHLFVVFIHTFTQYIALLSVSIFLKLTTQPNGIFSWVITHYFANACALKNYSLAMTFGVLSGWIFYLTLLLARFVFNTYHACMLTIAVEGENL